MTMTALDRALVTGDAGRVAGERQERPDPEVLERAAGGRRKDRASGLQIARSSSAIVLR